MPRTLVIVPCYNESENIINLVETMLKLDSNIEVLVVDDSPDNTADLVREKQNSEPRLNLIKREGKGGRGTAVLDGFRFALDRDYELIAEMDADFSHDPSDFKALINVSGDNVMVIGSRNIKGSKIVNWPWRRVFFHKWANVYARLILGAPINDYTNGYRVYGRGALQKLDMSKIKSVGYIVLSEISYQLFQKGVEFKEVPITFVNRRRGASNFSLKEIMEAFTSVLKIRFRSS